MIITVKPLQSAKNLFYGTLAAGAMLVGAENADAQQWQIYPQRFIPNGPGIYGAAGDLNRLTVNQPIFEQEIRNPGGINYTRPNASYYRQQGQAIAQPQFPNYSRTQINTPGFQGNFEYSQQQEIQERRQMAEDYKVLGFKKYVKEYGVLSPNKQFIMVRNYKGSDKHLIIPISPKFDFENYTKANPELNFFEMEKYGKFFLVSTKAKQETRPQTSTNHEKADETTRFLIDNCCPQECRPRRLLRCK